MQHIKLNTKQTAKTRIIKHNKPISTAVISFRASTACLIAHLNEACGRNFTIEIVQMASKTMKNNRVLNRVGFQI